jgi:hypothetical protein
MNFDHIVDLAKYKVYKPFHRAYQVLMDEVKYSSLVPVEEVAESICIVTANPTFGDVEGAMSNDMGIEVIRQQYSRFETLADMANCFPDVSCP